MDKNINIDNNIKIIPAAEGGDGQYQLCFSYISE
jgi:hypothetical protein